MVYRKLLAHQGAVTLCTAMRFHTIVGKEAEKAEKKEKKGKPQVASTLF